jgi:polyisoprenoid-binding protein YceI
MSKWVLDPDHSVAAFSIRHMEVTFVHGQMNDVSGIIYFDPEDESGMTVEIEIGVSSIITGVRKRDDHLKSADFFDAESYPKISFKSNTVQKTGPNAYAVSGDLSIHGTRKAVTLDVDFAGPVKSPFGETCIGLTGKTVLNREDFEIIWNEPLENGGFMVGKEVTLSVNLEADLTE